MARTPALTEVEVEVVAIPDENSTHIKTYSAEEYKAMSKANGTVMGRKPNQKTRLSTEELRVLINEKWTAEEVKEKHGLDDEELKQVVWKLSQEERLDKPIKFGKL
jgi:hypothetical protein